MRDAPHIGGFRDILLARDLFARRDVEESEVRFQPAVAAALRASGEDELRVHALKAARWGVASGGAALVGTAEIRSDFKTPTA